MSPERFSKFRLWHVFKNVEPPDVRTFDVEWLGGLWDSDAVPGVLQWFPKRAPKKAAILCVSGVSDGPDVRDVIAPSHAEPRPSFVRNADDVLAALDVPVRIGAPARAMQRWWSAPQGGRVTTRSYDERQSVLEFAIVEGLDCTAVVHQLHGLLALEIRRPDLIAANDAGI